MELSELHTDPIVEAQFQIRFNSEQEATANILAGMMYPFLKETYPKSEALAPPPIPKELLENDPRFKFSPEIRFVGESKVLSIGRHVMNIISLAPYCKWQNFKPMILDALRHLESSGLATEIERISFKYSNIIEGGSSAKEQFETINLTVKAGEHDLTDHPTQIRTEIKMGDYVNIIQVVPFARSENSITNKASEGLLLDIDTIRNFGNEFWSNREQAIEDCHDAEKKIFASILKTSTLERYT